MDDELDEEEELEDFNSDDEGDLECFDDPEEDDDEDPIICEMLGDDLLALLDDEDECFDEELLDECLDEEELLLDDL